MIKNGTEHLNGSDDWLIKELEREKRVSAWDFDEAQKTKNDHAENCDRELVADKHHQKHLKRRPVEFDREYEAQKSGKVQGKLSAWFVIDIILIVVLMTLNSSMRVGTVWPSLFLFLMINPGIFFWIFLFKRMPPTWYLAGIALIAILFELIAIGRNPYILYRILHYYF